MSSKRENLWGIVLSGGEGTRLQHFIQKIYGFVRPKQYCALVGTRSMLQHTVDRTKSLIPPEKILTVVNQTHLKYVRTQLESQPSETILVQPCGRETATGILLALLHVSVQDPDAVVGIFPSDHFVLEEEKFMQYIRHAFSFVGNYRDAIVLLAVPPSQAEPEYGWIERARAIANPWKLRMNRISRFWEKPDRQTAQMLFRSGCLWNTMVLVGTAATLLTYFKEAVPESFYALNEVVRTKDPHDRQTLLNLIYPDLPTLNFSKTILERCAPQLSVMEMSDVNWSDWGNESRVLEDVGRLHLRLHEEGAAELS